MLVVVVLVLVAWFAIKDCYVFIASLTWSVVIEHIVQFLPLMRFKAV